MGIFGEPWKKIRSLANLSSSQVNRDELPAYPPTTGFSPVESWDYELLDEPYLSRQVFDRIVRLIIREIRSDIAGVKGSKGFGSARLHWICERGSLPDGVRYFYAQPWNDEGWLFEEAAAGWTIARATKIVHERRFLRVRESWEAATLLKSKQSQALIRVSSNRYGDDPVCLPIYEDYLLADFRRLIEANQGYR